MMKTQSGSLKSYFCITREMQGIVGQASNFELRGQLSAFCARERLSQSSTELSCRPEI